MQTIEAEMFKTTASKPVYTSLLSNALRSACHRSAAEIHRPAPTQVHASAVSILSQSPSSAATCGSMPHDFETNLQGGLSSLHASPAGEAASQPVLQEDQTFRSHHDLGPHSKGKHGPQRDNPHAAGKPALEGGDSDLHISQQAFRWQGFEELVDRACGECPGPKANAVTSTAATLIGQLQQEAMPGSGAQPEQPGCWEAISGLDALKVLAGWPVSVDLLRQSQAGRRIRQLKKHSHKELAHAAGLVIGAWKHRLAASGQAS